MLIGRRYAGMSLRQIGEAIGQLSYPAVSDARYGGPQGV
jgi:hypothetical protein